MHLGEDCTLKVGFVLPDIIAEVRSLDRCSRRGSTFSIPGVVTLRASRWQYDFWDDKLRVRNDKEGEMTNCCHILPDGYSRIHGYHIVLLDSRLRGSDGVHWIPGMNCSRQFYCIPAFQGGHNSCRISGMTDEFYALRGVFLDPPLKARSLPSVRDDKEWE